MIAIVSGNEILWSFHIWVTGYNPDTTGPVFPVNPDLVFMDRNLGSNGNHTTLTPEGHGLYYQWGRKDPFPGARTLSTQVDLNVQANQYPIFNATGGQVYITHQNVSVTKNLENSLRNPTMFYNSPESVSRLQDWYTNSGLMQDQNNYLWFDTKNRKAPYDPCPHGWRVTRWNEFITLFQATTYSFQANLSGTFTQGNNSLRFLLGGFLRESFLFRGTSYSNIWYSDTNTIHGIYGVIKDGPSSGGIEFRKVASNIRCVKDTHNWYP
ncbi:MAG: hypothetical protein LUH04_05065 [Clostridium sp.]|nr:hypothetical protein [Clostridium sp.]